MAEKNVQEEVDQNCGKRIMELILEEYFGARTVTDTVFDNEECIKKAGELVEKEKTQNFKQFPEDHSAQLQESGMPKDQSENESKNSAHYDDINVIGNINIQNAMDQKSHRPSIEDKDRDVSANSSSSVEDETESVEDDLSNCIIEENVFNFSMFKTPMNDRAGPYYIDKTEVSVRVYQDGLANRWNPTQVLYELCSTLEWQPPEYEQLDYSRHRGFHFGVNVKKCLFVPKDRAGNKKLAKHYASAFFLHFLGFRFRFNDARVEEFRFKDSLIYRNPNTSRTRQTCHPYNVRQ